MEIDLWKVVCLVGVLLLSSTGSFSQLDVCGKVPLNTKIVGGGNAVPGAWPWQVSIQSEGVHFCGGSLINEIWVLSAAHCFEKSLPYVTISLGITNLMDSNSYMQQREVIKTIMHPSYNSITSDNDIALLQLAAPVTFNNYILPVCLAATSSVFSPKTIVWVTGWGDIRSAEILPYPHTLQEVQVPIVSNRDCANSYGLITDNMICAGFREGGKDACQGDSGGPMVVKYNTTWVQAGIVSFGKGCALPNFPGVYTRVSQYQDWINKRITSKQPGFVTFSNGNHGYANLFCVFLSFAIISFFLSLYNC